MRAARKDLNHNEIKMALEAAGASVCDTHKLGGGAPDIAVGFRNENYWMEIKQANGKVNKLQQEWHDNWRGSVFVVRTPEEALDAIGVTK